MKRVRYDKEKDKFLREKRGVGFKTVARLVKQNKALAILDNPNKNKYPNQKMLLIKVKNYIYVVPFVETDTEIFLKTIYPSRKHTKKYFKNYKLK